jgi:mono/diheme cytochrome c family protein
MKSLQTAITVCVILVIAAIAFAYSGLFNVAATEQHDAVSNWLLKTTRSKSIQARSGSIKVPDLNDEELRLAGINDFDSMCAECHTAPGRQPSPLARGLNPPAPDLAEEALEELPQVLFWVTKNGIRMTGMPAWGVSHDDDEIWPVIAFLQVLPDLDGIAYQEMLEEAEGHGHHAH